MIVSASTDCFEEMPLLDVYERLTDLEFSNVEIAIRDARRSSKRRCHRGSGPRGSGSRDRGPTKRRKERETKARRNPDLEARFFVKFVGAATPVSVHPLYVYPVSLLQHPLYYAKRINLRKTRINMRSITI